jgi:glutathione S-transferase
MSDKITLYGLGPSRSFRVLWALEEMALDYDYVAMDFADQGESGRFGQHYAAMNSQGKVPTLVDGDLVLTESVAILNYLATKSNHLHLIPQHDSMLRAKYDEMCLFIVTELEQPLWTTGKHKFALPEEYRTPDIISKTVHFEFEKAQRTLIKLLGDRQFAVGDQFTMADILLAQTIGWAQRFNFEVLEHLAQYRTRICERQSFEKAMQVIEP